MIKRGYVPVFPIPKREAKAAQDGKKFGKGKKAVATTEKDDFTGVTSRIQLGDGSSNQANEASLQIHHDTRFKAFKDYQENRENPSGHFARLLRGGGAAGKKTLSRPPEKERGLEEEAKRPSVVEAAAAAAAAASAAAASRGGGGDEEESEGEAEADVRTGQRPVQPRRRSKQGGRDSFVDIATIEQATETETRGAGDGVGGVEGRVEWQRSFDRSLKRLMIDFELSDMPACRLGHLDRMHKWFTTQGGKQARVAQGGPSYITVDKRKDKSSTGNVGNAWTSLGPGRDDLLGSIYTTNKDRRRGVVPAPAGIR